MSIIEKRNHIHFIGIGGVGMSGIALILSELGYSISGSDLIRSYGSKALEALGVSLEYGPHCGENLPPETDIVVYSSAVTPENLEYVTAIHKGIRLVRRGEFLAEMAMSFPVSVAVSGSHGKTTTTAMLVHILKENGLNPAYMVGGAVCGWESAASAGDAKILVTEIDESDGTQAHFLPTIALILNIEDDHAWSAGGTDALFQSFRTVAESSEQTFAFCDGMTESVLSGVNQVEFLTEDDIPAELTVPQAGLHNRKNAYAAILAAEQLGISRLNAIKAMATFPGVSRRMTTIADDKIRDFTLIEDYAHHPTEVRATIDALREAYPNRNLAVIFQPHRYERVKRYKAEFAMELKAADQIWVTPPFAAWVNDDSLASPEEIVSLMNHKNAVYIDTPNDDFTDLVREIRANIATDNVVLAVFGAGTITKLCPVLKDIYF